VSGEGATQATMSPALNQLIERAFKKPPISRTNTFPTEHLLLAAAQSKKDSAQEILARHGASHDAILKALTTVRGSQRVTDQNPEAKYQALERYARDLTEQARARESLTPSLGGTKRSDGWWQVLSRRTQEQSSTDRRARSWQNCNR